MTDIVNMKAVLFFFFLTATAAVAQKPAKLVVEVGKTREIRLKSNPTTGYHWASKLGDTSTVGIQEKYYPNSERIGSGGETAYTLKGLKKGTSLWVLTYVPPSAKQKPIQKISYIVIVR
ncbi:MAG: protease inhibitor I42 family protein [Siphonobacter sp.]